MPRLPADPDAARRCDRLLDLNHDHSFADDCFMHVGVEQVCALGHSGHRYAVTVPGPRPFWALYDEEEGDLEWMGEDEDSFDALYLLYRYGQMQDLGRQLAEAGDAVVDWLPGAAPFWPRWKPLLIEGEVPAAELARDIPGALALAETWAVLGQGRLRRHARGPAPTLRALVDAHPGFAPAVHAFFKQGEPEARDLPLARWLLEQRARLVGSCYADGFRKAARLLEGAGETEPMVLRLATGGSALPEEILEAARTRLEAGRFEAAANLAHTAIYQANIDAEAWYAEAHALLVEAAEAGGFPGAARTPRDDYADEWGEYRPEDES